jgi:hypothetical protein
MIYKIEEIAREIHRKLRDFDWYQKIVICEYTIIIQVREDVPDEFLKEIPQEYYGHPIRISRSQSISTFFF